MPKVGRGRGRGRGQGRGRGRGGASGTAPVVNHPSGDDEGSSTETTPPPLVSSMSLDQLLEAVGTRVRQEIVSYSQPSASVGSVPGELF